jgi:octaprenyl-diphosphate synthase
MTPPKERLLARVSADLTAVETALRSHLSPYYDLVGEIAGHLLFAGGKRLRPLMMLLSERACGGAGDISVAVLFEYLHAATLLHDDVVDGGETRRGGKAAHAVWGAPAAVLTGDFLLARSLTLAASTGKPAVIDAIARITENMSQGEIRQLYRRGAVDVTVSEYLDIIYRKTAVLIEGACRVGALIAEADDPAPEALTTYGKNVGIAFQIVDDLLDYTAVSKTLGKNIGADLREGKMTLPLIVGLSRAGGDKRNILIGAVANPELNESEFAAVREILRKTGALKAAEEKATHYTEAAKAALAALPETQARQTLGDIADYALARRS